MAGLLRMGAALTLGTNHSLGLSFSTDNAAVARKVLVLLKEIDGISTEVTVRRSLRLKKNNSYHIKVVASPRVAELLDELGFMPGSGPTPLKMGPLLRRNCCRWAYLRGAFLGGGSVNRPEAEYHLELVMGNYQFAELVAAVFKRNEIEMRLTDRKDTYVIYMKECDAIIDFLSALEADKAVEAFEVARNLKEVRNQVNRLVNCETANLQKTANAAARQVLAIEKLMSFGRLEKLKEPLRLTAVMRLENPDAPLSEIASELGTTRSTVAHRLKRLEELAEQITENEAEKV